MAIPGFQEEIDPWIKIYVYVQRQNKNYIFLSAYAYIEFKYSFAFKNQYMDYVDCYIECETSSPQCTDVNWLKNHNINI